MEAIQRTIKYEADLSPQFSEKIHQMDGGASLWRCIQCGLCSATCPLSIYMDYTPRRIMAMTREGFKDEVLGSRTIWLCASCYACTVLCPQNVEVTHIMYHLKQMAIQEKRYPRNFPIPVLAREFSRYVREHGRASEFWVVFRTWRKIALGRLLRMIPQGIRLWRLKRLPFGHHGIRQRRQLKQILAQMNGGAK